MIIARLYSLSYYGDGNILPYNTVLQGHDLEKMHSIEFCQTNYQYVIGESFAEILPKISSQLNHQIKARKLNFSDFKVKLKYEIPENGMFWSKLGRFTELFDLPEPEKIDE